MTQAEGLIPGRTREEMSASQQVVIQEQLHRILGSPGFADAPRLQRLLEYVAQMTLAGRERDLRESVLGIEVFDRDSSYDPGKDSIVRANARRLRKKLDAYYVSEGQNDSIRIQMPKGHYKLTFTEVRPEVPAPVSRFVEPGTHRTMLTAGLILLLLLGGLVFYSPLRTGSKPTLTDRTEGLARVALGVEMPMDTPSNSITTEVIGRNLIAALNRETRLQIIPLAGDTPSDRKEVEYLLRSIVIRRESSDSLSVDLTARDGGYVILSREFPLRNSGDDLIFEKSRLVANLSGSAILYDGISRNSLGFSNETARLLYVRAIRDTWLQSVAGTFGHPAQARIKWLEQAISLDPSISAPWSALAGIYAFESVGDLHFTERSARGNQSARQAIDLATNDTSRALAYAAAGYVKYGVDLDFDAAKWYLKQAQSFGYLAEQAAYHLGEVHRFAGELEEAAQHYELARALAGGAQDPWALINLASTYMYLGRYEEMLPLLDVLERSVAEENEAEVAPWLRVIAYHHQGKNAQAAAELDRALARMPNIPEYALVGWLPLVGRDAEARTMLQKLDNDWVQKDKRFRCRDALIASFFLDEPESMYRWLDRAIERREIIPRLYGTEFDKLRRNSPRFREAMERMGRLAFWRKGNCSNTPDGETSCIK